MAWGGGGGLRDNGQSFQGKRVVVSGSGNVAIYANQKVNQLGGRVVAMSDADVPGGHVGVRADVTLQFRHEGLAEPHDLAVALALGVEVAAALAAAHGQGGEGVLEDLLKAQEFDDGQVDGGVKARPHRKGPELRRLPGPHRGHRLRPVLLLREFLKICSKPRNLMTDRLTEG